MKLEIKISLLKIEIVITESSQVTRVFIFEKMIVIDIGPHLYNCFAVRFLRIVEYSFNF